tara:strand:- start:19125 stop:19466 length:342 start_codon:yes stop_codon:yes gene_type:complete
MRTYRPIDSNCIRFTQSESTPRTLSDLETPWAPVGYSVAFVAESCPIALGRSNWLFAGSLRGGQRAAAVMSLIQSAKQRSSYLKDVLNRLPTQPAGRIEELLPHRWSPPVDAV